MTTSIGWRLSGTTIGPIHDGAASTPAVRAALMRRLRPTSVIARRTAAWIWGFDLSPPAPTDTILDVEVLDDDPPPPAT